MAPKMVREHAITFETAKAPTAKSCGPWLPGAINWGSITNLGAGKLVSPRAKDPTNDPDAAVVIHAAVVIPRLKRQ
jgi:hypothetical protein